MVRGGGGGGGGGSFTAAISGPVIHNCYNWYPGPNIGRTSYCLTDSARRCISTCVAIHKHI